MKDKSQIFTVYILTFSWIRYITHQVGIRKYHLVYQILIFSKYRYLFLLFWLVLGHLVSNNFVNVSKYYISISIMVWKWGQVYTLPKAQSRDLVPIPIFIGCLIVCYLRLCNSMLSLDPTLTKEAIVLDAWLSQKLILTKKL